MPCRYLLLAKNPAIPLFSNQPGIKNLIIRLFPLADKKRTIKQNLNGDRNENFQEKKPRLPNNTVHKIQETSVNATPLLTHKNRPALQNILKRRPVSTLYLFYLFALHIRLYINRLKRPYNNGLVLKTSQVYKLSSQKFQAVPLRLPHIPPSAEK